MDDLYRPANPSSTPLLTLAMIVLDGGQNLAYLLEEASAWTDEIVIGDTGSIDGSRAVAADAGAQVFDLDWTHDFAEARNRVLRRCSGAWILCLDADERLAEADWAALRRWVESAEREKHLQAGQLVTRNYVAGRHSKRDWRPVPQDDTHALADGPPAPGFVPSAKVRLFPNRPDVEFRGRLHETVEASLREACIPVVDLIWPIHHFGTLADDPDKANRYRELARLKTVDRPHNSEAWAELADCAIACGDHQEALCAIDRALVLNPTDTARRLTAGWLLMRLGKLGPADLQLAAVAGSGQLSDAQLAEACHLRAQIAMLREQTADASPLLAIALRLYPENGYYLNTLGAWQLAMGRGEPARLALEKAAELIPENPDPHLNLGLMYEAAGHPEQAEIHLRRALDVAPDCQAAVSALARLGQTNC